jgi:hypothetical protein
MGLEASLISKTNKESLLAVPVARTAGFQDIRFPASG